jgi:hypothetical protein
MESGEANGDPESIYLQIRLLDFMIWVQSV